MGNSTKLTAIYPNGETREEATARVNARFAVIDDEFVLQDDDEMSGIILAKDVIAEAQARLERNAKKGQDDDTTGAL